uniref:NADH-ubiquinone oxidoreductase chain 6 n=1 Tax=Sympiezomias velatus TaxID=2044628 RepID=A0A343L6Q6_9CUCU|nr:NADH dehydrogenase subunit 6 [Sympiezomias velatus]
MLLMMILSWTLSLTFTFLKHPLSLGFIVLLQTIITSLYTGLMNFNYWFSYILFLIMIGGMLILFIYMTSVASNEKFKFSLKLMFLYTLMILIMSILMFSDNYFSFIEMMNFDLLNQSFLNNNNLSLNKFLNYPNMMIMFLLISYLLATLIAIVKITQNKKGPLRKID